MSPNHTAQERPRPVHFGIEPEVEAVPALSVAPLPPLPPREPTRALDAVVPDPPLALFRPAGGRDGDGDGDGDGGAATPLTGVELLA
jgi:hypothetical protein